MKYGLPVAIVLVFALLGAVALVPELAGWIGPRGDPGSHAGGYGVPQQARAWPVGSWWLIAALAGFAVAGAGVVALAWWIVDRQSPPPEPDPKVERVKAIKPVVAAVNRRSDLTAGEKQAFDDSAHALARADDAPSIAAAALVGADDAVTGANRLAKEAESVFLNALRHAANIALPFSDKASTAIAGRRSSFAEIDDLLGKLKECEEGNAQEAAGAVCVFGPFLPAECLCEGEAGCAKGGCVSCHGSGARSAARTRVDVVFE